MFGVSNIMPTNPTFLIGREEYPSITVHDNRVGIGTLYPQDQLDVYGGIKAQTLSVAGKGVGSNLPSINPSAYPSYFIYEPCDSTTLSSGGILYGNANLNQEEACIELTKNENDQQGSVFWQLNPGNSWACDFQLYTGDGTTPGADGTAAVFFSTIGSGGTEDGTGSGYAVSFNEVYNTIWLIYGNQMLASTTCTYIGNSTWHQVRISYILGHIHVMLNGVDIIRYKDVLRPETYNPDTYCGFIARNGSLNNNHRLRNIRFQRVSEGLWRTTQLSSGASDLVYEYGNVGIGLKGLNRNPEAQLHVGSNLRVDGDIQTGNVLPSASNTYDLGSLERPWRDLYLGGNSLIIGGVHISKNPTGAIVIDAPIVTTSITTPDGKSVFFGEGGWDLDSATSNVTLSSSVLCIGIGTTNPSAFTHISRYGNRDIFRVDDTTDTYSPSIIVDQYGNVGFGTDNPGARFEVADNVRMGSGVKGSANGFVGGPFFKQASWDEVGDTHTIVYTAFSTGDNSAGTLHLQVSNKDDTFASKIGTVILSFMKRSTQGVSIATVNRHLSYTIETFEISVSGDDIVIVCDSDCAISWSSIGSF